MSDAPQVLAVTSAPALREWTHHVESVLRGIAHSMNNRAAALSAVAELSSDPGDDAEEMREILEAEMSRIQELVHAIRLVGAVRDTVEALAPADVLADVKRVLALHTDLRDREVRIHAADAPPVRVPRALLVRSLVALGATTPATADGRAVELRMRGQGDWLVIEPASGPSTSTYAGEVAVLMGGESLPGGGLRIPTLAALRRREGRPA